MRGVLLFSAVLLLHLTGCAPGDRSMFPTRTGEPSGDIIVFNNHWHAGVILPFADLPAATRSQLAAFAGFPYVAVGWGDTDFFRAAHVTPRLIGRAMFFSRGTVLLIVGVPVEPEDAYAGGVDVYRIHASRVGYARMIAAVDRSFARADGKLIAGGRGEEGFSEFFTGVGHYSALRTCNVWTADMLRAAGLPITPAYAISADNLEYQIRQIPGALRDGKPFPPPAVARPMPLVSGGARRN